MNTGKFGSITRRGRSSWRIKYPLPSNPRTGKRRTGYETVNGEREDAERRLRAIAARHPKHLARICLAMRQDLAGFDTERPADDSVIPPPLVSFGTRLHHLPQMPVRPCIYFLCWNNEIVYIGKTLNIYRRVGYHLENKRFNDIFFLFVSSEILDAAETAFLRMYKPRYNTEAKSKGQFSVFDRKILEGLRGECALDSA